jgi:DNA-binding XRE family transcriptional regulator
MTAKAQMRAKAEALRLGAEMDLAEVRRALRLSQDEIAQVLHVGQASIAKIEKRADMYVSTLRRFIEAMGGELDIIARFPGKHSVKIKNFSDLSNAADPLRSALAQQPATRKERRQSPIV